MFLKRLKNLLSSIPKNLRWVDLVVAVHTYRDVSIKSEERENRNSSSKILSPLKAKYQRMSENSYQTMRIKLNSLN